MLASAILFTEEVFVFYPVSAFQLTGLLMHIWSIISNKSSDWGNNRLCLFWKQWQLKSSGFSSNLYNWKQEMQGLFTNSPLCMIIRCKCYLMFSIRYFNDNKKKILFLCFSICLPQLPRKSCTFSSHLRSLLQ